METILRLACAQMNSGDDMDANCAAALALLEEASDRGAQLITLPENAFLMRGSEEQTPPLFSLEDHPGIRLCREVAARRGVWVLIGSVFAPAEETKDKWYNRSVLLNASGEIVAQYDKIHLFDAQVEGDRHYLESARILPGTRMSIAETPWGGLGLSICYDLRFGHLYRDLAKAGASLIAVPAAFTATTGAAHWHTLLRARAIETGCFIVAPAQCGQHPGGKRTYGHSLIIDPWGTVLAEGSAGEPGVILADLDPAQVTRTRHLLPSLHHDRPYET